MSEADKTLLNELRNTYGFSDIFADSVQDAFFIVDPLKHIVLVNNSLCQLTGFSKDELMGLQEPIPFWPAENHNKTISLFDELPENIKEQEFEVTFMHKNGKRINNVLLVVGIKNRKDATLGYLAIVQGKSKNENGLEASKIQGAEVHSNINYRKKYVDLFLNKSKASNIGITLNNISDGFVSLDTDWCYTYINEKAGEFLGRKPSTLIGKHIWTEFPDGIGLPFYKAYYKAVETQKMQYLKEYYPPFKKWFENRIYPSPEGLTIYFTDITERVNIENQLIESEKYLDNIINNISDPIFLKDDQSRLLTVNDAFCKMFNLLRADIIGKTLAEDVTPKEREHFLKIDKLVLEDGVENISEESLTVRENKTRIISTKKTRFIDTNGTKFLIGIIRDITEKKEAETNNSMLRSLVETSDDFIGLATLEGKPIYLNNNGRDMAGLRIEEDLPANIAEFFPENYQKTIVNEHMPTIFTKRKWQGKAQFQNLKSGELIPIDMSGFLIKDRITDNSIALGIVARNISEQIKVNTRLIKSRKSLIEAQKIAKIGSFNINLKTKKIKSSATLKKILGVNMKSEITADIWKSLLHVEDVDKNLENYKNSLLAHDKMNMEFRILTHDSKTLKWIHGLGEFMFADGEAINFFGTAQDITERKLIELKLSESEFNLRQSQKVANIGSFSFNIEDATWESSISMDIIYGIDESFVKTFENWSSLLHPDGAEELLYHFENNVLKHHERFDREYRIIRVDDKKEVWVHGIGELIFDNEGTPVRIIGTTQDITDRKIAEIELKLAKDFSENLILNLNEGLSVVNFAGVQIDANPAMCKMLGFNKEELIGQKAPFNFWPPEEYDKIYKSFQSTLNGNYAQVQLTFMRKNGERFPALITTSSVKNNEGENIAIFAIIQDISKQVKAQELLESVAKKSIEKKNVIMELTALIDSDYNTSLKQITALSASVLNVARVGIWKFNDDKTNITCDKLFVLKTGEFEEGSILYRHDNPKYFDALLNNKTISVKDAVNDKITEGFAQNYLIPLGITSMLDVFIQGNQGMYGVICFEHIGDIRDWTADDEEFATSIASIAALMVEGTERKIAEKKLVLSNTELTQANKELNTLRNQLEQENIYLRNELDLAFNYEEMIYGSEAFSNVLSEVEKVAPTNATVLLLGESGTGKELLARAIHNIGLRNKKPLIKVNCSAIPRELMESELFGHKKGSFTGAFGDKIGKFELADGGTLFLDEIGELPLDMQPKILRFLQEGEIEVVGGQSLKKLDVRVIAATNRDLKEEIAKSQFREDLYFRLNVFPIEVPSLRSRVDDIPLLVEHFVDKFNKVYEKSIKYIPDDSMTQLISYKWPGNIRELENLMERAIILSENDTLLIPGFETSAQTEKKLLNNKDYSLNTIQKNHIFQVLEECNWKISGPNSASEMLDLKPSTLRDKMTKLKIIKPL